MDSFNGNTNKATVTAAGKAALTRMAKRIVRAERAGLGATRVPGYNTTRFLLGSSGGYGASMEGLAKGSSYSSCLDVAKGMDSTHAKALCDFVLTQAHLAGRDEDRMGVLRKKADRILLDLTGGVGGSLVDLLLDYEGDLDGLKALVGDAVEIPSEITDVEEAIDFALAALS